MLLFLTNLISKLSRKQEDSLWFFKVDDRVTWNEKTGVDPGVSYLAYEKEFGKVVTVEEISPLPQEVLKHYTGSIFENFSHQYVKIKGQWFSTEWFKPVEPCLRAAA